MKVIYKEHNAERKLKRKRTNIAAVSSAAVLFCASALMVLMLRSFTFLPAKYRNAAYLVLAAVNAVSIVISLLPKVKNGPKILCAAVSLLLSVCLITGDIVAPLYKGKLERLFTDIPSEGTLNINVYVLKDSSVTEISEMMGRTIGIQTAVDREYQEKALETVNSECSIKPVIPVKYDDVYSLAEALFRGEVEAILLDETYIEILGDNDDFEDIDTKVRSIYTCEQEIDNEFTPVSVDSITAETFLVLVGGNDTYSYNLINYRSHAGRTDTNILAVVNPVEKQILMVTIPRDSYVPLYGDSDKMDKLTHATVYDLDCWKGAINELLDCNVNYFVRINFASLINIVDALGGITVNNPYSFSTTFKDWTEKGYWGYLNYDFPEGELYLNGHHALAYVRERKYIIDGNPIGDQGRNKHQAIVMKALIEKVTSVSVITHINDLLDAVKGTFSTDISTDEIYSLINMQLTDMASWDFMQYNLTGNMEMATSYAMGKGKGPIFEVCMLDETKVQTARELIDQMLEGQRVTVKQDT